jgi:signal transduction histidine kinase
MSLVSRHDAPVDAAPSTTATRLGIAVWAVAVGLAGTGLVSGLVLGPAPEWINLTPRPVVAFFAICFVASASVGAVLVARADGHPIGWLFLAAGALYGAGLAGANVAKQRFLDGHVDEFSAYASWVSVWSWELAAALGVLTVALFPDRRPRSRGMRALVALIVADGVAQLLALALLPGELDGGSHPDNPVGIDGLRGFLDGAVDVTEGVSWVLTAAAVGALLLRYRRADAEGRRPLRWLVLAVVAFVAALVGSLAVSAFADIEVQLVPFFVLLVAIPVAMATAILKDRLYDIELIVNRAVVWVLLAGGVTGVYVLAVLVARALFVRGDASSSTAAVVALVVVALGLAPARERLQRVADRVVFGRRATPYHALASFAEHSAGAWSIADTAPRLAGLLSDATGAATAVVYVRADDELVPVAREPRSADELAPIPVDDPEGRLGRYSVAQLVERRGEVLGAVALTMPPGVPVRAGERRVVRQLAAQAALSFETLRLTADLTRHAEALAAQAEELRRSRLRLVQVQDAERHRIGRDLHDGAQQHLVAILTKAGLARSQLSRDPALADGTIVELQQDTKDALHEIREFVHGISPQILADRGLVVAVQQRAARLPVDVVVECDPADVGRRFDRSVESTAWFVFSEALTNVLKHARAERVTVRLCTHDGAGWGSPDGARSDAHDSVLGLAGVLGLEVADDGIGLRDRPPGHGLTNMGDRVAALGGTLSIEPDPRGGTILRCSLPLTGGHTG